MKKNEILKPCPFCGSEVEIARLDMDQVGITSLEIRCRCGAEIRFVSDDYIYDWTDTPHQMGLTAIEKFNNRVTDGDAISRCELFNLLATIPAPPEANDLKAEIYKVIQSMETVDAVYFCNGTKCERCSPECELTRDPHYAAPPDKVVIIDRCGYCMGASFNDCEECHRRRDE